MNKKIILGVLPGLVLSQPALSVDDVMIVSATRTAQTVDETLSSVSVVTKEDIKKFQYKTVEEALGSLPGVMITNTGGRGKQTSIFLRGTESNHTQVLLNGAKLATNAFGAPQIEHIPIELIDRIELVRGPQSGLYGSGSIGGTIQIFTKKGVGKITPTLTVGFGSHDTKETSLSVIGGDKKTWYNIAGSYKETGGFDLCNNYAICDQFAFDTAGRDDKDGYSSENVSIRVGHQLLDNANIEFFSLYSEADIDTDGFINDSDVLQHTFGLNSTVNVSNRWTVKSVLSQGRIESHNRNNASFVSTFSDNQQDHFSLQSDYVLSDTHLLTLGYDYEDDKIETDTAYTVRNRHSNAFFGQILGKLDSLNYQVAIRNEEDEQFGSNTTGNISIGVPLNDNLSITAAFGKAFVAPSLIDLYFPFGFGNPSLDPEQSKSYEVGLMGQHLGINWSANVYHTKIEDLIALDAFFVPQNISEAEISGIELQASTVLAGVNVNGQVSLLNPEDKSGGINDGNVLPRRAEQTFTLNASKRFDEFSVAGTLNAVGRRFDDAANTARLGGYATLDLAGSYSLSKTLTAQLKVANVFNKKYETVNGFNADGTNVFLSITYQPEL